MVVPDCGERHGVGWFSDMFPPGMLDCTGWRVVRMILKMEEDASVGLGVGWVPRAGVVCRVLDGSGEEWA